MSGAIILYIFIFIVVLLIFLEYRNEKKYQEERRKRRQEPTHKKKTTLTQEPKKVAPKPESKPEPKPEPKKEVKKLPEANYPKFTHIRLVEMGLSDEEAKEFVAELIPQIEVEIPLIEAAIKGGDFHKMERLTHGIKGSATNLGTGGVSDLLTDYNTYLKSGTDIDIAKAYFGHLIHYTNELKAQYS